MGEFPDEAIQGSNVPQSTPVPRTTAPTNPVEPVDPDPAPTSSGDEVVTSTELSLTPVPTRATSSSTFTGGSGGTSRTGGFTSRNEQALATTSEQISPSSSTQVATTTSNIISSSQVIQTSTQPSMTLSFSASTSSTSHARPGTMHTSTLSASTRVGSTKSIPGTSTRPIITPMPTGTMRPTSELLAGTPHLSFGVIVAIVGLVFVALAIIGTCAVLGPKRALRKVGVGRPPEEKTYEEWENGERQEEGEGKVWGGRPESMGANSDWWRAPAGALGSRVSTVSVAGPGMAGVGAGKATQRAPSTRANVEERRAVRSGWFATSMVRGASLLSLGSIVRPVEPPVSEMPRNRGGQGSAGRRFQELYRRERGMEAGEMGERQRSGRVSVPGVRRPSRLGAVPAILVHDATLPSLSSVSNVTHGSGGRGYDADWEGDQRVY
ncbi:hypothetical protein BDV93DRAFT_600942 [Ceratobasidium sp. AG-I]|nr:hypothetical protein BDV93DRAFT_600942 [Ceratobasidium sp. AG-I]